MVIKLEGVIPMHISNRLGWMDAATAHEFVVNGRLRPAVFDDITRFTERTGKLWCVFETMQLWAMEGE